MIVLTHFFKMAHKDFAQEPGLFEIMGGDFLLDDNLKLWFIEMNSGPGMSIPS